MSAEEFIAYEDNEPICEDLTDIEIRDMILQIDQEVNESEDQEQVEEQIDRSQFTVALAKTNYKSLFKFFELHEEFKNSEILDSFNLICERIEHLEFHSKKQSVLDDYLI